MPKVWKKGDTVTYKQLNELQEKADKWDAHVASSPKGGPEPKMGKVTTRTEAGDEIKATKITTRE